MVSAVGKLFLLLDASSYLIISFIPFCTVKMLCLLIGREA